MARTNGLVDSIADVIGDTPLLELHRLREARGFDGRILCKLDHLNPGFSKKDRIAREMVLEARARGELAPGQPVVELTSGNTGTGLALVCTALGHPVVLCMSRGNSIERARMMQALGAEVVLVDQAPGSVPGQVSGADLERVEVVARELTAQRGAFRADQFNLWSNVLAHERHTGPEFWEQSGGTITAFVDFVGSGGTFLGTARHLRSVNPQVTTYVVEPAGAAVLAGRPAAHPNHRIQGGGYSMPDLPLYDAELVTDHLQVTDDEAMAAARELASTEGVFAGFSTGANLAAALQVLEREPGATVGMVACDSGLKYLSTDLYPWREPGADA